MFVLLAQAPTCFSTRKIRYETHVEHFGRVNEKHRKVLKASEVTSEKTAGIQGLQLVLSLMDFESILGPKIGQKTIKNQPKSVQEHKNRPQEAPRALRVSPNRSQDALRAPISAPKTP